MRSYNYGGTATDRTVTAHLSGWDTMHLLKDEIHREGRRGRNGIVFAQISALLAVLRPVFELRDLSVTYDAESMVIKNWATTWGPASLKAFRIETVVGGVYGGEAKLFIRYVDVRSPSGEEIVSLRIGSSMERVYGVFDMVAKLAEVE